MSNGFLGSSRLLLSQENIEVLPKAPAHWTDENYVFFEFSFINKQSCSVKINGGQPIYLEENQGFESNINNVKISSFVIVEANIDFNWIGAY